MNVSSGISQNNIYTIKKIIKQICIISNKSKKEIDNLINYVEDRPGHDSRYAMANKKFKDIFPRFKFTNFNTGIEKTIEWYITNNSFINESKKNLK